jgi:hypothetical protein
VVTRVGNAFRGLRDPDLEAQRRIAANIRADMQGAGLRFSPEEAAEADIAGTPRALLDTGENTRALARSAANTSPDARAALTEFTQERFEQQSPRIATYIRDMTGGGNATEDLERIQDVARRSNRRPGRMVSGRPSWSAWQAVPRCAAPCKTPSIAVVTGLLQKEWEHSIPASPSKMGLCSSAAGRVRRHIPICSTGTMSSANCGTCRRRQGDLAAMKRRGR